MWHDTGRTKIPVSSEEQAQENREGLMDYEYMHGLCSEGWVQFGLWEEHFRYEVKGVRTIYEDYRVWYGKNTHFK